MKKRFFIFCASLLVFTFVALPSFAESSYVLPYPSSMPGSIIYKPHLVLEKVLEYWYFGNFGQFEYNLKQSDKYLVEAKTLFEYNQYLFGYNALKKSDAYFIKTLPYIQKAESEGKDISQKRTILSAAAQKHVEVLTALEKEVPESFVWQPEKAASSFLNIKYAIESSILYRQKYL